MTLPGGSTKSFVYDPLMRVKEIAAKDPGQNILLNYHYDYDKMDNITGKGTEHGDYQYQYDNLYRLTAADNPIQNDEVFTYDSVGNRLTSADTTGSWSYNNNNELLTTDNEQYQYDANGNMTQKTVGSVVTKFFYNLEDRLERVEDGSGNVIASYYYDPFGRRLWKEVADVRKYFHYADEGLVAEMNASGDVIKTYGYKPGSTWSTDPLFMKVGTEYYFYHNDQLGTPQKLTSVNGAVAWSARYTSFGKADVDPGSTVINNLRFPGQYYDKETETYYNYNRYYSFRTGRFDRTDPIGIEGGQHLFLYGQNNPLKFFDPLGLECSSNCPDCKGSKWDVDTGMSIGAALFYGRSRGDVTFTCLSNGKKCSGKIDCKYKGLYGAFGINFISIDFHEPIGPGRTISGYPCYSDIEKYESKGWEFAFFVGSTSGNNIAFGIGKGAGFAKTECKVSYMSCPVNNK